MVCIFLFSVTLARLPLFFVCRYVTNHLLHHIPVFVCILLAALCSLLVEQKYPSRAPLQCLPVLPCSCLALPFAHTSVDAHVSLNVENTC